MTGTYCVQLLRVATVMAAVLIGACGDERVLSTQSATINQNTNNSTQSEPQFGDRYWATLAQDYEPFEPDLDLGFATDPALRGQLGSWGPVTDWPLIATGAANLPDGRIIGWASSRHCGCTGRTSVSLRPDQ
jgi:hypothetical protein